MKARLLILVIGIYTIARHPIEAATPEPSGYRMDDYNAPVPDTLRGGRVLHTADLKALIDEEKPLLIDVLPAPRRPAGDTSKTPWMPLPHRDLPGSYWLPDVGRGALDADLARWFRSELDRLAKGNRAAPMVFYCRPQCWMSWNAAKRAVEYGFENVIWYPDGVEGWESAGFATSIAAPTE